MPVFFSARKSPVRYNLPSQHDHGDRPCSSAQYHDEFWTLSLVSMRAFCCTDYSIWQPELIEKVEEREDEQMNRQPSDCLEPVAVTTAALFSKKGFQKNQARLLGFIFSPSISSSPWKTTPAKVQPSLSEQNQVSVLHGGVGIKQRVRQIGSKGLAIQTEFRLVKYSFSRIITGSC